MAVKKRKIVYKTEKSEGDIIGPFTAENSRSSSLGELMLLHPNGKVGLTAEGGLAVKLTNKTNYSGSRLM